MRNIRKSQCICWLLLFALLMGSCKGRSRPQDPTPVPATPTTLPTAMVPTASPTPVPSPTARPSETAPPTALPTAPPPPEPAAASQPVFAAYQEPAVQAAAALPAGEIAPNLENVRNPFALSPAQITRLAQDGFVVSPGDEKEFFMLYEDARYRNIPIFVTSDSLLHIYHLLFDKVLRTAEATYFIPLLQDLNAALLAQTDAYYQSLQGTDWADAARRTVAFVAVAGRLLDPEFAVPPYALDLVEGELANIEAASGILPSPIFPGLAHGEDYTQYIPRGHYTRSEALQVYFKSMMWYGRMTFRLKTDAPEVGRAETRAALLVVHALRNAEAADATEANARPAMDLWRDLYSPTVFFVGRSDDLTVLQYADVMDEVYGENVTVAALVDEAQLDRFIALADQLPPPRILGIVIADTEDEESTTKGLRLMGQRFVPDAYIFRELIYRNVGTREQRRGLPMGLDVFAAMGSERAYQILDTLGETDYQNYPEQMDKMRTWLAGLDVTDWTETLYNTWLYTFHPLLEVPGEGYPSFMQSTAWLDKQLNTVLGSWAELKHDTILYAKQAYAELGGGPPPPPPLPPKGYVEPVPFFYARLAALTTMTREGLQGRGLLTAQDLESLQTMEDLSLAFQRMAEKELRGEPLTEEEYTRIRFYGGELEHLTMAAADMEDPEARPMMDEEPQAAVIADVATGLDPDGDGAANPVVLEVAVGRIHDLHVVVPIVADDGSLVLQVAKGGVFSYYEFPWPADDRLTDEKWRQMLAEGQAPDVPGWTQSFRVDEGEYDQLQSRVLSFQKSVTGVYWMQQETFQEGSALAQFGAEIQALRATKRYLGHQLVSTNFRSFDLQSPTLAVVTVRETWQDTLYAYEGEQPAYYDEDTIVGERGPYTLDVTYTLEAETLADGVRWQVTQAVYANEPPPW